MWGYGVRWAGSGRGSAVNLPSKRQCMSGCHKSRKAPHQSSVCALQKSLACPIQFVFCLGPWVRFIGNKQPADWATSYVISDFRCGARRSALFCAFMLRRFLPTFRDNPSAPFSAAGPVNSPETSVRTNHSMPRNIPKQQIPLVCTFFVTTAKSLRTMKPSVLPTA
jgi:hypothetical protein